VKCKAWRKLISLSLDEQLTGKELLKLNAHLQSCSDCSNYLQATQMHQAALKELSHHQAPYQFNQAIWRKIEQPGPAQFVLPKRWGLAFAGVAMATITLVLISKTNIFQSQPIQEIKQVKQIQMPISVVNKTKSSMLSKPAVAVKSDLAVESTQVIITLAKLPMQPVVEQTNKSKAQLEPGIKMGEQVPLTVSKPKSILAKNKSKVFAKRFSGKKTAHQKQVSARGKSTLSSTNSDTTAVGTLVDATHTPDIPVLSALVKVMNNKIRINQQDKMGIQISLGHPTDLVLKIYNRKGKMIKTLHEGILSTGSHNFEWDGTAGHGESVASGIYVLMIAGDIKPQKYKIAVIK